MKTPSACRTHVRLRGVVIRAVLLASIAHCSGLAAEDAPAQRELRTYPLHGNVISADISPDERFVATLLSRSEPTNDPSNIKTTDSMQLWDFRQDKLKAEKTIQGQLRTKHEVANQNAYVRYSADGKFVIAYLDHSLYIFGQEDLREISRIPLKGPPDLSRSFTTKTGPHTVVDKGEVAALELSPVGQFAAILWVRGLSDAWVDLVQIDSAKEVFWNTKEHGVGWMRPRTITWSADGQRLVLAVPNGWACGNSGNEPDVFAVEPASGAITRKLATGFLVGEIAVTPDGRVLAVDNDCVGVFRNHDPKLRVFDLNTGKKIKELSGRGGGVRYEVSASRTGDRAVADTGIVKDRFDWGDMVPSDVHVDSTFSVWNIKTYEGVATSQNLANGARRHSDGRVQVRLRISSNGGFVLKGSNIYELP
jgi:WD40 repeat protein